MCGKKFDTVAPLLGHCCAESGAEWCLPHKMAAMRGSGDMPSISFTVCAYGSFPLLFSFANECTWKETDVIKKQPKCRQNQSHLKLVISHILDGRIWLIRMFCKNKSPMDQNFIIERVIVILFCSSRCSVNSFTDISLKMVEGNKFIILLLNQNLTQIWFWQFYVLQTSNFNIPRITIVEIGAWWLDAYLTHPWKPWLTFLLKFLCA